MHAETDKGGACFHDNQHHSKEVKEVSEVVCLKSRMFVDVDGSMGEQSAYWIAWCMH